MNTLCIMKRHSSVCWCCRHSYHPMAFNTQMMNVHPLTDVFLFSYELLILLSIWFRAIRMMLLILIFKIPFWPDISLFLGEEYCKSDFETPKHNSTKTVPLTQCLERLLHVPHPQKAALLVAPHLHHCLVWYLEFLLRQIG